MRRNPHLNAAPRPEPAPALVPHPEPEPETAPELEVEPEAEAEGEIEPEPEGEIELEIDVDVEVEVEVEDELAEPEPAAVTLSLPESEQEPVTDEELSNAVASAAVSAYERELMSLGLGELSADLFGVTPLADAEKARPVANVRPERRAPEPVSEPASLDVPPTETETTAPDEAIDLSALLESLDRTQDETPPLSDESPALDELGSVELEELESEDLPQAGPAPSEPETVEMAAEPLSAEMSYDGIGLSGGMTDELSALTGADRPARPVVSVSRIPDRGSGVLMRDQRVDKQTVLKIIDGIKNL